MRKTPFYYALQDWLNNGGGCQRELIEGAGLIQQTVSAICSGKSNGLKKNQVKIAEYICGDYDRFINRGREIMRRANAQEDELPAATVIEMEHDDVVAQFQDKITALAVNRALLTIEKLDRSAFTDLAQKIIGQAALLKESLRYGNADTMQVAEKKTKYYGR